MMTVALIIATGKTTRSTFEPLKEVGSITAIQRIALVFHRAGIERIVIVYDSKQHKPEQLVSHMQVEYLAGSDDSEMLTNVKIGLDYLQDKCTAALITTVNVPLFSVETIRTLIDTNAAVCSPRLNGKGGHPLRLSADCFPFILSYEGPNGLAGAIRFANLEKQFIDVDDEGILVNIQAEDDFMKSLANNPTNEITSHIQIRLVKEKPFYGPGPHQLLQLTRETNSLSDACRKMGISYSKGRKLISTLEQQLGYAVVDSYQGGRTGGSSFITIKGEQLMQRYNDFCAEAQQSLNDLYDKYFDSTP